jgi:hypothetical protein
MLFVTGAAVVALLVILLLFRAVWRVAEPNEALIISGLGAHGEASSDDSRGFKIVVGRGTAVLPGFQTVRRLPLGTKSTGLIVNAVSNQSIPLTVKGIVAFKVGDDQGSIRNAARRFLEQKDELMLSTIHELFAGHLRAIVGGMSVEDMLHNREELTANIRSSLADDLGKLGLVVDSLQIQEIDDESGYIANLASRRPRLSSPRPASLPPSVTRRPPRPSRPPTPRKPPPCGSRRSRRPVIRRRSTRPRPRLRSPARSPRPRPARRWSAPRRRPPSSTRRVARRCWSPRSASRPTPRPTAR